MKRIAFAVLIIAFALACQPALEELLKLEGEPFCGQSGPDNALYFPTFPSLM